MPPFDQRAAGAASPLPAGSAAGFFDNPIWSALTTEQRGLALGTQLARRFPPEIGPLSGLVEQTDAAYDDLHRLTGTGGIAVLFLEDPPVLRQGWSLVRDGLMSQMIWSGEHAGASAAPVGPNIAIRRLTQEDVPAMVELAHRTEPGPFQQRTHELGVFFGIFEDGRLLAMTGQRLHLPGFVEISAVCTHPDARGRGYARILIAEVIAHVVSQGETPFLHVFAHNAQAIRVYQAMGFAWRRSLHLAALKAL